MNTKVKMLTALLLTGSMCFGAAKQSPGRIEGSIRDTDGRPIKGVSVGVSQGWSETKGQTTVIPIYFPNIIGAVVVSDPNATVSHPINAHRTKTDKDGHYSFKKLAPGSYILDVYLRYDTPKRLKQELRGYKFPNSERVQVMAGQAVTHDEVVAKPTD